MVFGEVGFNGRFIEVCFECFEEVVLACHEIVLETFEQAETF